MLLLMFVATGVAPKSDDSFIEAVDNIRIHVRRHAATDPKAVLIMAHGLQSHAGWFEETGEFLAAQGITVLAYDRRGSGKSEGSRGDVGSPNDFEADLDAAVREASKLCVPVHLLANCFATRSALPYVHRHCGVIRSLILTSPATDMRPEADYSPAGKLGVLLGSGSPVQFRILTPLKDDLFVSTDPWLQWIHDDKLSLRRVTPRFLFAARRTEKEMFRALSKAQTPVLVMLATRDRMVFNERITERFKHYSGPVILERFESEHMLEFGASAEKYRHALLQWIQMG